MNENNRLQISTNFTILFGSFFTLLLAILSLEVAAPAAATGPMMYQNINGAAGINAPHIAHDKMFAIGQAWGDFDNNGHLDLYLTNSDGPNQLYANDGDGTFTVSSLSASVALTDSISAGTVFVDYDNDGWQDIFVANWGVNALFHNDGGAGFTEVAAAAGVAGPTDAKSEAGSWGDFNQDGWLDLYVVNYTCTDCNPVTPSDSLYLNNGDGTFTDVSTSLDDGQRSKPNFIAAFLDFDNDGDSDIYVVSDRGQGNALWRNDGPGCAVWCFTDVSASSGADTEVNGMGIAVGDYDRDGDFDLFFTDIGPPTLLQSQVSQGSPTFVDVTAAAGVQFDAVGWGAIFFDSNNDGWPDIYMVTMNAETEKSNRLFINNGDGTFTDVSASSGINDNGATLGLAYGHVTADGWIDLIIGNYDSSYVLYENQSYLIESNNWLRLRFVGQPPINRDAVGTRAYVHTSDGAVLMQEVKLGSSMGAGNDLALHFGLGSATVDSIIILWPNGFVQELSSPGINQAHLITSPTVTPAVALPIVLTSP